MNSSGAGKSVSTIPESLVGGGVVVTGPGALTTGPAAFSIISGDT